MYGLPEVNRAAIRTARIVGNPGCYATTVQLGFLPLVESETVDLDHLVADAKSGVSGAGRKTELPLMFSEAADNFSAYNVAGHRHVPEIRETFQRVAGRPVGLVFVPASHADGARHLRDALRPHHARGGLPGVVREALRRRAVRGRPARRPAPETRSVRASNTCRIAVHRPGNGDTLVILAVIDNLVKGASGQAVQNMNIMFGLDESLGLAQLPVLP